MEEHHLYEINDAEENDVFKYGISGDELLNDGTSPRANKQVNFLNLAVGWMRYFSRILLIGLPGKRKAEEIESEYIQSYYEKNGRYPRGNIDK
jgi:hypothetical protein